MTKSLPLDKQAPPSRTTCKVCFQPLTPYQLERRQKHGYKCKECRTQRYAMPQQQDMSLPQALEVIAAVIRRQQLFDTYLERLHQHFVIVPQQRKQWHQPATDRVKVEEVLSALGAAPKKPYYVLEPLLLAENAVYEKIMGQRYYLGMAPIANAPAGTHSTVQAA